MTTKSYYLSIAASLFLIIGSLGYLGYHLLQKQTLSLTTNNNPATKSASSDSTAGSKPAQGEPTVALTATGPIQISIAGHNYQPELIDFSEGKLTLYNKAEPGKFEDIKLIIDLSRSKIDSYSGKSLHFSGNDFSDPAIQVNWMLAGETLPKSEFYFSDYDLRLQFGQEENFLIPVKINLATQKKLPLIVSGSALGKTSDLVIVNGVVDTHQDNDDTVMYVIEQFILAADKVESLALLQGRSRSMSMPFKADDVDPNPKRVYSSAEVSFDFDSINGKEEGDFQLVRDQTGWKVFRVSKPLRLAATHQPDLSLDTLFIFDHFGRIVVEKEFGKENVAEWDGKGAQLTHKSTNPKNTRQQHAQSSYAVKLKDGRTRYLKVLAVKNDEWEIKSVLDGSKIVEAHMAKPPAGNAFDSDILRYLSAVRLEQDLNNKYKDLQIRTVNFSCGRSNLLAACQISWTRLFNEEEHCESTQYMYNRPDQKSEWQFVKMLAADEQLDHRDGQVKKLDKPRQTGCW